MSNPAILVEGVTVHYGEVLALDAASLSLDAARICGLVGMNGSGKSTLFKAIMGMIKPDAGRVLINGEPPAKARKEGGIGYVPQSEDVDWQFPLSVRDVVMMGRYGHQGFTRRASKVDRAAVDCPNSPTGRSASSPVARRSASSWPGGSPREPP
jgi:manganese transport system ATP-binding protein